MLTALHGQQSNTSVLQKPAFHHLSVNPAQMEVMKRAKNQTYLPFSFSPPNARSCPIQTLTLKSCSAQSPFSTGGNLNRLLLGCNHCCQVEAPVAAVTQETFLLQNHTVLQRKNLVFFNAEMLLPSQLTASTVTRQYPLTFSPVLVKFSTCKAQQDRE